MTKAQLRTAIKREARINSSTNLDPLVDDIVADLMTDFCNKTRYHELLLENVPIVLIAATGAHSLPANFQNLACVRYGVGPSAQTFHELHKQTDVIHRQSISGYPKFYRFVAGSKISMFPFDRVLATDSLLIDYYVDPATLYTAENSPFPVPRLETAVKKAAIARVQRFSASTTESQMTERDGDSSFIAGEGGS